MKTLPALLSTLLLVACQQAPTRPCNAAAAATVPMWLDRAHPSIDVRINGGVARMLLDTGSDQIALSSNATERLGLQKETGSTPGSGAAGSISASKTSIADLAVGEFHLRKQVAYVVPFPAEFHYDGVLGTPFFAAFVTTTDYQHRRFTLEPHNACVASRSSVPIPIRQESGKLLVQGTAGGVSGWFSVDTGAGNALTFFSPTVARLRLRESFSPTVQMVTGVSPGGYTHGALVRVPKVEVGPYSFARVVTELSLDAKGYFANSPHVGNLGGEIWRRFSVTLDYRAGQMYLTPNDAFAEPFVGPRSGLAPAVVDGVVKVIDVFESGPAAAAGVHVGDTIVAMVGTTLDTTSANVGSTIEAVVRALRAEPGTTVRLRLRDASGAEREVELVLRDLL